MQDRLSDFTADKRILVLSALAVVIGALSALVAFVLIWLIGVITNLSFFQRFATNLASPADNHMGVLVVVVPVIGGLIIGLMARYGSDKIRGHGIPEALEAILIGGSRMQPKMAILKPVSSAISIGTGGPFGAEGPIIMTGGAIGSLLAQLFKLSSAERKTLLVAGAAGGMAAIFAAPVSAVILALELLLFEWKPRSFIPVAISAAIASALRVPLLGAGPIFPVVPHAPLDMATLGVCIIVGVVGGLGAALVTNLVYTCEHLFEKLPVHWMWWPAIGGLFVGIGGLIDPRVLGVGYDVIHTLLRGDLLGTTVIVLLVMKAVVWSIALGSGTSGGVVAPLLMMGGAIGALMAQWIPLGDTGLWAMIGMAAVMGAAMGSPLTALVFTLELTHDLNALPGLLAGVIAAHAVTVFLMRRSILTEKVARRGTHLSREYSTDPLDAFRVSDVMDANAPAIPATMTVSELSARIARADPQVTVHQAMLIVDENQRLCGIITRGDLLRAMQQPDASGDRSVYDAGTRNLILTYPDELLRVAVERMLAHDIGRLPVVSRNDPYRIVGYLGRSGILKARQRRLTEESVRARSWDFMPGKMKT